MCSILFSTKYNTKVNINDVNYYNQFRGPDNTKAIYDEDNKILFIHNLLSITGNFTEQPFVKDDIVCLYNGEIYNYKNFGDYNSDGECLIDLYKTYGNNFTKMLDGEFAIVLLDIKKDTLLVSSDIFKTKPLFYCDSNGIGVSTYSEPLKRIGHKNIIPFPANTTNVYKFSTLQLIDTFSVCEFDLNQHKNTFNDWIIAFENSIKKRTKNTNKNIFLGLSSGYDSGAIVCELLKQDVCFRAYSVLGAAHDDTPSLKHRHNLINSSNNGTVKTLYRSSEIRQNHKKLLESCTEQFTWTIESSSTKDSLGNNYKERHKLSEDRGSTWLSFICSEAIQSDFKIYLSGQGADEIFSDYGFGGKKFANHSNFGGLFPLDLKSIFPWNSFYKSSQESYLAKEEYTSGMWGIETRYPFLDKNVVQEFLWLSCDLKNKYYKSVLHHYFISNNFPFDIGRKVGF